MNADDGRRNVLTVTKPLASERSYSRGGTAGAATKRHGRAGEATAGAARQAQLQSGTAGQAQLQQGGTPGQGRPFERAATVGV